MLLQEVAAQLAELREELEIFGKIVDRKSMRI